MSLSVVDDFLCSNLTTVTCVQALRKFCQTEATRVNCRLSRVLTKTATHAMVQSAKLGVYYLVFVLLHGLQKDLHQAGLVIASVYSSSLQSQGHKPLSLACCAAPQAS